MRPGWRQGGAEGRPTRAGRGHQRDREMDEASAEGGDSLPGSGQSKGGVARGGSSESVTLVKQRQEQRAERPSPLQRVQRTVAHTGQEQRTGRLTRVEQGSEGLVPASQCKSPDRNSGFRPLPPLRFTALFQPRCFPNPPVH